MHGEPPRRETAKAADTCILKGGGTQTYEPRFAVHGFRCVEVTGFPGTPTARAGYRPRDAHRCTGHAHLRHRLADAEPAARQYHLRAAGELPLRADRHPGPR
ncbi:family 78 glycoside hydrolase catalytic domain [Streptomyces albogriseolus]